jgi:hypothetical protein
MQPLLQWEALSMTYSERVFVALGTQHAMRMCHIVICGLFGSTIFFHVLKGKIFEKKVIEHKTRVSIFSTNFVRNISY